MTSFNLISILLALLVSSVESLNHQDVNKELNRIQSAPIGKRNIRALALSQEHNQSAIKHVVVATLEAAPFMMKRSNQLQDGSYEWYGYCMDLFNELIKHLPYKVTYEIYQVQDNKFGSKSTQVLLETDKGDNRSTYKKLERWTGLIGDLQKGKAHLALAPLAVMAERELAMDFTVPFYDLVGIQILLKRPDVPQDWFKFLTVLDGQVWLSLTVAYFFTSFIIFLFDRLSPYSHKNLTRIKRLRQKTKRMQKSNQTSYPNYVSTIKSNYPKTYDHNSTFIDKSSGDKQHRVLIDPLVKSHQLFVGSSVSSGPDYNPEVGFLSNVTDSVLASRRRNSKIPYDMHKSGDTQATLQNQRGSMSFSDYIRGIDLRTSSSGRGSHDDDSSDVDDGKPDFGLRDSLWFCITSLTPQGGGEAPQNLSGRIVAGAWWLFCFIIIASYTANLAAFLTVSRLDIPIENLDDLVKQYRIKYAPVDGTAEQTYFKRMAYIEEIFYNIWKDMSLNNSLSEEERSKFAVWDYPISDKYTKIWSQIQQVGMPEDTEAGIQRVKKSTIDDGFALLADANVIKHAVMTDCSLKAVGDEFSRKPIALGVRKGDEKFRDDLSYAILQLINQRYMEILREKWWTNNPKKVTCSNNDESEGINMENIGGVFIIIFTGVGLSFLAWAIERFVYKTKIDVSLDLIQRL